MRSGTGFRSRLSDISSRSPWRRDSSNPQEIHAGRHVDAVTTVSDALSAGKGILGRAVYEATKKAHALNIAGCVLQSSRARGDLLVPGADRASGVQLSTVHPCWNNQATSDRGVVCRQPPAGLRQPGDHGVATRAGEARKGNRTVHHLLIITRTVARA